MSRRLDYRVVGDTGDEYPEWLHELADVSGVYVIRSRATKKVLYVGESHTGNLFATVTRHLSFWHRAKRWWHGGYGAQQHDPGTTYKRADVEVAAFATKTGAAAVTEQDRLIRRLRPKDNIVGKPETDSEVPF
jgi:hypothetical protein